MNDGSKDEADRKVNRAAALRDREASDLKRRIRDERDADIVKFDFDEELSDPRESIVLADVLSHDNVLTIVRMLMSDANIESLPFSMLPYFLDASGYMYRKVSPKRAREFLQLDTPPFEEAAGDLDNELPHDFKEDVDELISPPLPPALKPAPAATLDVYITAISQDPTFQQMSEAVIWEKARTEFPQYKVTRAQIRDRLPPRKRGPKPKQP